VDFARQLKSSIDIVAVIGERVPLKKSGAQSYIGLCPFHQEKSGSFNVHKEKQFYHCFGCGAGGDVFKFVMEYEGLSFAEAMASLAERYGIPMPKRTAADEPEARLRTALHEMHEIAARHFQQNLDASVGAEARAYLSRRGLTATLVAEFRLGYGGNGKSLAAILQKQGFPAAAIEASGLIGKRDDGSYYDTFYKRLIFPIANEQGKVIAFGGRAIFDGQEPKYRNSAGSPIYQKSEVLYSLHRAREAARRAQRVVLVEGYMDVIGAWSAGVAEACAPCGTALTAQQVKILRKFASDVVLNFDPDSAGANAAEKSIQLLLDGGFRVMVASLEGGLDPDEYVRANGADVYMKTLANAPPYYHWLANRARQKFNVQTSDGKKQALEFLLPHIRQIQDPIERAWVANELASITGVEQSLLLERFRRAATHRAEVKLAAPVLDVPLAERLLLELILASAAVRQQVWARLSQYPALRQSAACEYWQALLEFSGADSYDWETYAARLSPEAQALMPSLIFADHSQDEDIMLAQAEACLSQISAGDRKARIAALKFQIREAEKRGAIMEALLLAEELDRPERNG
jgi:DNA primase